LGQGSQQQQMVQQQALVHQPVFLWPAAAVAETVRCHRCCWEAWCSLWQLSLSLLLLLLLPTMLPSTVQICLLM
jgi:hypothetical protein